MRLKRGDYNHFDESHIRGEFQYITFFVPAPEDPKDGQAIPIRPEAKLLDSSEQGRTGRIHSIQEHNSIGISDVGVVFTAAAGMKDPQAYNGFFNSTDELLNQICMCNVAILDSHLAHSIIRVYRCLRFAT